MTSERVSNLLCGAILIAFAAWIAMHSYWTDITVTTPLRGDAVENPYYGLEHLARELGSNARQIPSLRVLPPPTGILYVRNFRDDFLHHRVDSLEPWVRSGGRLVIVGSNPWSSEVLKSWSGISSAKVQSDRGAAQKSRPEPFAAGPDADCAPLTERINGELSAGSLLACPRYATAAFDAKGVPAWTLSNAQGTVQALRMNVGRGSVTAVGPGTLFDNWGMTRHDHARILVAATQLRRGDEIAILNPSRAEPLLSLVWRLAAPAVLFVGAAAVLLILRNLPRFGPPVPVPSAARRSLAEQIQGNARFAWAARKLAPLRLAEVRALEEAAIGRIAAFATLTPRRRAAVLAQRTGLDAEVLHAAMSGHQDRDAKIERDAIELLERARRLLKHPKAR
jgi:hypothetical protein